MNAATTICYEAGIRKAAILVASVDESAAERLLAQLGPERAELVRRCRDGHRRIDAEEQQRVIDEFRRIGPMLPPQCPPGIELDGPMAARTWPRSKCGSTFDDLAGLDDGRCWRFFGPPSRKWPRRPCWGQRPSCSIGCCD